MSWNTLPDELLHEILVLHFARVPEAFCGDPTENLPPLERQRAREMVPKCPPSGALLVSKSWLRVGTPLLYEFLSLSKPKHTQRVAALFRAHPTLGNYVRHVRLRGGLVEQLGDILGAAPNVESLSVSLKLRPRDNVDGLLRVIPALNPSVLYLRIPWEMSKSHNNVAELRAAIETAIATHWTSLKTLYLFQYSGVPATLLDAIHESPSLEEISINGRDVVSWLSRKWIHSVARNERISKIVYRGEDPDIRQRQRVADNFRVPPEMLDLLEMVEDPPAEPWTEQPMRPIRRR